MRFLTAFGLLAALTTIWALASPLMAVPDEQAHTIKAAAVVRGQLQGESGISQGERSQVVVPAFIAAVDGLPGCFAWKETVAANCSPQLLQNPDPVKALTSAGNYNPMYYAVTGLPSLYFSGAKAIYAMRVISGLLSAAFLALTISALGGLRRPRLPLIAGSIALTPMVFFLSGAVNPNALEIATSLAVFSCLCLSWERISTEGAWKTSLGMAAFSAAALANTRAASLLWLALAVVGSLLIFGFRPLLSILRQRFLWAMILVVGIGCALSVLWLKSANSLQNLMGQGVDATPLQVVIVMLDRTFDFSAGYVSYLGWLDTLGPAGVLVVWSALIVVSLVTALSAADRAGRVAVAFLLVCVIVLPPLLQIPLVKDVGYIWQGRYILALVAVMIAACGVALRGVEFGEGPATRRAIKIILGLMVFGHLYSFVYGMRRYVIGIEDRSNWSDMFRAPLWQPPLGWITLTLLYLAVLVAGAAVLNRYLMSPRRTHSAVGSAAFPVSAEPLETPVAVVPPTQKAVQRTTRDGQEPTAPR
ncbi:DUF2142 domain-containing protein [Pseudarthrobacter sp. PH31-O2]|uniref:DUF2142 domain-containing protein n=1 Tax=Pseudarthrobacter sp. PH31-O2 TaxID=3046206 RepID=UPI0024BB0B64|nr:DUF2142 domain-containing protein [Pseudarthrobacter sp. PH31-O2]MDJ0351174.1 DUF2142 domain-containing protein [Pseudarthrobacter sp. PH31-O2]